MGYSRGNIPFALPTANRNYYAATILSGVPILDQDLNLQQRISADRLQSLIRAISTSGWLTAPAFHDYGVNVMEITAGEFIVDGFNCIWDGVNNVDNQITFVAADPLLPRDDLVWVEIWLEEVDYNDTIYMYGNEDYYGTNPTNDIVDPAVGFECTRRIQIRYRTRVTESAAQVDDLTVFAQGSRTTPGTFNFTYDATIQAYVADTSDLTYSIVDGRVYGMPICTVARPAGNSVIAAGITTDLRSEPTWIGLGAGHGTFTDGDTTPSVVGYRAWITDNTGATVITNFLGADDGKEITIVFRDNNTTIVDGAGNIALQGAANFNGTIGDTMKLVYITGLGWFEVSRSVN